MEKKLDLSVLGPDLLSAVRDIATLAREAGGRALMVGGSVRDLLMGVPSVKDVDLEVFGIAPERLAETIGAKYPFDPCGVSFGVLKIQHLDIDVSLPRRESKRGEGHKGFLVDSDPFLTVKEAASRRDFTVNAMYYDPLTDEFEDPYGGVADLRDRVLRHVSPKFVEDPLRVLRGMQFVARFGLTPAEETVEICRTMEIEGLPPERLFEEWAKLLTKGHAIGNGLEFLRRTGWVRYFPELERLIGCRQDPKWHPEGDVWEHVKLCLDAFARRRTGERDEDLVVGFAVLCHDLGKPATTRYDPVSRHIRSLGHDEAGVEPTLSFLRRLTNEERFFREVPPLVRSHMQPFAMWRSKVGDAAVRRLAVRVGRIDRLIRVAQADDEGRPPELAGGSSGGEDLAWLAAAAERLRVAASVPKPILMGRHLIEMGYRPSSKFKKMLDACYEAQLDGRFADLEGARQFFRETFAQRPTIEVVGGIIRRDGRYLLGRRAEGKSQGGLWEFIGGKIEPGETPEAALARECREEIALEIVRPVIRTSVVHDYPDRRIRLTLIDCEPAPGAEPKALEHGALGWYTPQEMKGLAFCPADAELVKRGLFE